MDDETTIASKLTEIAASLSGILTDSNTQLSAKEVSPADNLSGIPDQISAIETGSGGITPTGTKSITTNGTHDVTTYASAEVNIPTGTPRSGSDLTVSGNRVSVPAGLYSSNTSKDVAFSSQATPSISVNTSTGKVTSSCNQPSGYVTGGVKSAEYQLTTQAAQTIHPSLSQQTIASGKYLTGAQTIKAVQTTNLIPGYIKSGVTVKIGDSSDDDCVTAVTGTYSGGASLVTMATLVSGYLGNISYHSDGDTDTMTIGMGSVDPDKLVGILLQYVGYSADLSNKEIISCLALKATANNSSNPVVFCRYGSPGDAFINPSGNVTFSSSSIVITSGTYYAPFSPSSSAYTATAIVAV